MIKLVQVDDRIAGAVIACSPVRSDPRAQKIMNDCLLRSEQSWAGIIDGDTVCIWGLIPPTLMSDQAYIWMLHTEELGEHKFAFVRHSQIAIQKALEQYPIIVGHVLVNNHSGRQWLKWLGATFADKDATGAIPFTIRKKALNG